jgi:hypothetical protein
MRHSASLIAVDNQARRRSNSRRFIGQMWRDDDQGTTPAERFDNTREGRTEPKGRYHLVESHAPRFARS